VIVAVVTLVVSRVPVMVNPVVLVEAQITWTVAVVPDVTVTMAGGIATTSSRRLVSGSLMDGHDGVNRFAPVPTDRVQLSVDSVDEVLPPVMKTLLRTE
jgi:hypothetical protein